MARLLQAEHDRADNDEADGRDDDEPHEVADKARVGDVGVEVRRQAGEVGGSMEIGPTRRLVEDASEVVGIGEADRRPAAQDLGDAGFLDDADQCRSSRM